MQPNNPFDPEPTGIDYLNHIAPPPQKSTLDNKFKAVLIIAGIVGLFSVGLIAFIAFGQNNSGPSPLGLMARLQKLEKLSGKYGSKLRTIPLQDANSSLSAVLISANKSIYVPIQDYSINLKKEGKKLPTIDPSTELEKTFDDASLNSTLDTVYAREMTFQLEDTLVMMNRLYRTTKVASMKSFLEKNIADFENLKNSFEKANTV